MQGQTRYRRRTSSGQGITDYGAILAFAGFLIGIAFIFETGKLGPAVNNTFKNIISQMNTLTGLGGGGGGEKGGAGGGGGGGAGGGSDGGTGAAGAGGGSPNSGGGQGGGQGGGKGGGDD